MHNKLVVFTPINFFEGMAGSKRIAYIAEHMPDRILIRNLVLRSNSSEANSKKDSQIYCSGLIQYYKVLKNLTHLSKDRVIYHYDYPQIGFLFYFVIGRILGFRFVFDIVEDYRSIALLKKGLKWKLKIYSSYYLLKFTRLLKAQYMGISMFLVSMLEQKMVSNEKVLYLPIAIKDSIFERKKMRSPNCQVTFFYGGTFVAKDDIMVVMQAFESISRFYGKTEVKLILSGKTTSERISPILSFIENYGLSNVEYLGFLNDEDYYNQINDVDVLIMPRNNSSFANTGFPFKLGEYMATGNCTIASKIDSVSSIIPSSDIVYYTPSNVESLFDVMKKVVSDNEFRIYMGQKSQNIARQLFSARVHSCSLTKFIFN